MTKAEMRREEVDRWSRQAHNKDCPLCSARAAECVAEGLQALERYPLRRYVVGTYGYVTWSRNKHPVCVRVELADPSGLYVRRLDGVPGPYGIHRLHLVTIADRFEPFVVDENPVELRDTIPAPPPAIEPKQDTGKRNWDMILVDCAPAVDEVMSVLEDGVAKYGPGTTWKTVTAERYKRAAMRHLLASARGERINTADGDRHHLAHAIACLLFALTNELEK